MVGTTEADPAAAEEAQAAMRASPELLRRSGLDAQPLPASLGLDVSRAFASVPAVGRPNTEADAAAHAGELARPLPRPLLADTTIGGMLLRAEWLGALGDTTRALAVLDSVRARPALVEGWPGFCGGTGGGGPAVPGDLAAEEPIPTLPRP